MISVTMLSSYTYCPRKLYLERVMRITKPPKAAMIKGTVRHNMYDEINKIEKTLVKSIDNKDVTYKDIKEEYKSKYFTLLKDVIKKNSKRLKSVDLKLKDTFLSLWPIFVDESKTRSKNIFDFIEETGYMGERLWEELTPKIESETWIESKIIGMRGIIDQIEAHKDGRKIPIELKTGKMPEEGVWPGHKFQIGAYLLLINDTKKTDIKTGYIRYLDYNETREINMNPFFRDEIFDLRDDVVKLMKAKDLPKIIDEKNKCNSCELREKCYSL